MKEVTLPSGAILKITLAPFADSKALYQAFMREAKGVKLSTTDEVANVLKDLICVALSSSEIESRIWDCLKRCTLNTGAGDLKIESATFEPAERRDDYWGVCIEVAKENILPFGKSLYAEYLPIFQKMVKDPPSRQPTTTV